MTTQKQKFPVLHYPIRGSSLTKKQRVSLVRRAMAGEFDPVSSGETLAKRASKRSKGK